MANIFSGSEIIEFGIQIEKNGRDFYNTLSKQSNDPKSKDIFRYLAAEEEKHIAAFQNILNNVEKYEQTESYPGEYSSYMNTLASEYVFTKKDKGIEMAKNMKSDKEAVELGIGFEKDSIIFYTGMKRMVQEYDRKVIENLIAQEQDHLKRLYDLKRKL